MYDIHMSDFFTWIQILGTDTPIVRDPSVRIRVFARTVDALGFYYYQIHKTHRGVRSVLTRKVYVRILTNFNI